MGFSWDWCELSVGTAHPEPESGSLVGFKREVGGREEGGLFEGRVATFTKKINYNLRYLMTKKLINKNVFLCHN